MWRRARATASCSFLFSLSSCPALHDAGKLRDAIQGFCINGYAGQQQRIRSALLAKDSPYQRAAVRLVYDEPEIIRDDRLYADDEAVEYRVARAARHSSHALADGGNLQRRRNAH